MVSLSTMFHRLAGVFHLDINNMPKKLTTEGFIEKARAVHGDKYDYSNVVYVNRSTKVTIICPEHGEFEQKPDNHVNGKSGCHECGESIRRANRSMGLDAFILKAREVHGDTYDYGKVTYVNNHTKVIVTCKKHGDFKLSPQSHLDKKQGCSKCVGRIHYDTKSFIAAAKEIHEDTYDYSEVKYISSGKKIKIKCRIHGAFMQAAGSHLYAGCGCPKCGGREQLSTELYIKKAKEKHGDTYNYSKIKYEKAKSKIFVLCKIHGGFYQEAHAHLSGQGCPDCASYVFPPVNQAPYIVYAAKMDAI